ncbi:MULTISPECIES: SDR family NAD(P)-dependent oxidoreductase [Bradyrhizobium]|uniref:SDR family NAD(P)-dependent oxidoreductase n=1 Tax=Bradyrhizobium TaxID=374 RepID=UPI000B911A20|nr:MULTISPECIES: SDR family NAD(P)-dependent oxidoreductase [Bradyrhizobium]PAY07866.1 hypothetical protein CK489_19465 [Bradyrhizobium sp. UFLA03-84]
MASAIRALVTGGANGIGAAVCRQLARDGMMVAFCDRDAPGGNTLADEIGTNFVPIDVTDDQTVASWLDAAGLFDVKECSPPCGCRSGSEDLRLDVAV